MKENYEYKKNKECAAFDELLIYPFFSSYEGASEIISSFLGEEIRIEAISPLFLDHIVGKMAVAIAMEAVGGDGRYFLIMKKIGEDDPFVAIKNMVLYSLLTLSEKREEDGEVKIGFILVVDKENSPSSLVIRDNMKKLQIVDGDLKSAIVFPRSDEKGELRDMILELNDGERGPLRNKDIRECIEWLLSDEGKEVYSDYWEMIDSRWKANLACELIAAGLTEEEIKKTLEMSNDDISLFRGLKKARERFLSYFID